MRRRDVLRGAVLVTASAIATRAYGKGEEWPNREINVIVPTTPGGSADLSTRALFTSVGKKLGAPIVIKNVPGGGGTVGAAQIAAAKPDGYTIGLLSVGGTLIAPHMMAVPYSWASFEPLGAASEGLYGLAVAAGSPVKSVEDLVALAKTRRVTVSANNIVNVTAAVQLGNVTGTKFQWVPTNSQSEAVSQAAGGHVDATLQSPPDLVPLIQGGQMRLLASCNDVRWPTFPEVRTLMEMGYAAQNKVPFGFATPAGVDLAVRKRLEAAIVASAADPEVIDVIQKLGVVSKPLDAEAYFGSLKSMAPMMEKMLDEAGMKKKA